jgi:hypothetical protein
MLLQKLIFFLNKRDGLANGRNLDAAHAQSEELWTEKKLKDLKYLHTTPAVT